MTAREQLIEIMSVQEGGYLWPRAEAAELVDGVRAEALAEAADHFRRHCLTHNPDAHHGYMQCHCAAADELPALTREATDA